MLKAYRFKKKVKNKVNLTLFPSQLWRYKKQTTDSKGSYVVGGLDKTRSWARCGPRAVVGLLPL